MPIITGEVSGANPVEGVLSIDGKQVLKVRSNDFTYTPTEALSDGAHNVSVEITDANGRKAQASTDSQLNLLKRVKSMITANPLSQVLSQVLLL
jgi:hypothetical protein